MRFIWTLLVLFCIQGSGYACSCTYPTEVHRAFEVSHTVVYGQILSLDTISYAQSMDRDSLKMFRESGLSDWQRQFLDSKLIVKARLLVKEKFKETNRLGDTLELYTTITSGSCGYTRFRLQQDFIIYTSPISYCFSIFYNPVGRRKLEKLDTYWVTHCSITSEFTFDHYAKLRSLVEAVNAKRIAKVSYKTLSNRDLLREEVKKDVMIVCEACEAYELQIELSDEEAVLTSELDRADLIIRIRDIQVDRARVWFKSYDHGGSRHTGEIILIMYNGKWYAESVKFVSAVD